MFMRRRFDTITNISGQLDGGKTNKPPEIGAKL
jgi:hypothetical protein